MDVSYSAPDFSKVVARKDKIVQQLVQGLSFLMQRKGVEVVYGEAEFLTGSTVRIGDTVYEPERILVASGTTPLNLP